MPRKQHALPPTASPLVGTRGKTKEELGAIVQRSKTIAARKHQKPKPSTQTTDPENLTLDDFIAGCDQIIKDKEHAELVRLGFPQDHWLPIELARAWRSRLYPTQPTKESVERWQKEMQAAAKVARAGEWKSADGTSRSRQIAESLTDDLVHDLDLLRQHGLVPGIQPTKAQDNHEPSDQSTILHHGQNRYSIGNEQPVAVTDNESNVLQAFIGRSAMHERDMVTCSGVNDARRVLKSLKDKYGGIFRNAINLPGKKGCGGYSVALKAAPPTAR